MRVITGSARGRRLQTLDGTDIVRPTSDMVKEAIFSIIQFEVPGKKVLDLFAGSGQLGIEALSRGAEQCVFVEPDKKAFAVIKANVAHCGLQAGAVMLQTDALSYLRHAQPFDIGLFDPPYRKGLLDEVLPLAAEKIAPGGLMLCETQREETLPVRAGAFAIQREYCYGKTKLTLYRAAEEAEA